MTVSFESTSVGLVIRLTSGVADPQSWERFVYTYGPQFIRWCRDHGLQEADALDVSQEVLLRISKQLTRLKYDPTRSFRGWLHAVIMGRGRTGPARSGSTPAPSPGRRPCRGCVNRSRGKIWSPGWRPVTTASCTSWPPSECDVG